MKKTIVLITVFILVGVSCKKVKIERLTIGDERKMLITDVDIKVNTFFKKIIPKDELPKYPLDLDNNGEVDILLSLTILTQSWIKKEGDGVPWIVSIELLNSNFSIREIIGSNKLYRKSNYTYEESTDGVTTTLFENYVGCENIEGAEEYISSSYILAGDVDGKFGADNGNWSHDINSHGFIVAESVESVMKYYQKDESEYEISIIDITKKRNCHTTDISKPVYIQFKSADKNYKLGWIELIFEDGSFTINRHAISKKIIKE